MRPRPTRWAAAIAVAALVGLVTLAGCTSDTRAAPGGGAATDPTDAPATTTAVVDRPWPTATPAEAGIDPSVLDRLAAQAERARSSCLLVARHGRLVGEWYWGGSTPSTPRQIWSITKSIASLLTGLAVGDGRLSLDTQVAELVPAWRGTPADGVTVRDLLAQDSGRAFDPFRDIQWLFETGDQSTGAVALPQVSRPGTVWAYNNPAVQVLEPVLRAALGTDVARYAADRLFGPLGMADTALGRDAAGNPLLYAWGTSTCRDLAALGTMVGDGGRVADRQVVPEAFVQQATAPGTPLNAAHGLLWWLNRPGSVADTDGVVTAGPPLEGARPGPLVAGAPAGLVWARGAANQLLQVDPASGTVLVRLSDDRLPDITAPFGVDEAARLVTEGVRP